MPQKSMAKEDLTAPFSTCKWARRAAVRMLKCQACLKATMFNEYSAAALSLLAQTISSTQV